MASLTAVNDSYTFFLPYVFVATLLVGLALLRGWRVYDQSVDRALALMLVVAAAAFAGALDLGTDAAAYQENYRQLSVSEGYHGWWEPGFELLAAVMASAGIPYGLFVGLCVLASHLMKLYVYDKLVANRMLILLVLFCFNLGEIAFVRQYVAASLIFLSFYLFARRRNALAVLSILLAVLFHKSALAAGLAVVVVIFGRATLKPIIWLALATALIWIALPRTVVDAFEGRIYAQVAAYTLEGFVQGLQDDAVSGFRNVAKFSVYIMLALWMNAVPATTPHEAAQRKSGGVVVMLSVVSLALTVGLSPVFARLSAYIFPFLALAMRAERFEPRYSELPGQCAMAALFGANLLIQIYPLAAYL